jgi:hypothetical protein
MCRFERPSELSPEQRRRELVALFARGLLRLRVRCWQESQELSETPPEGLEVPRPVRLSVTGG